MSMARIVVVGAGQAGGWAARTLRKEGFAGTLTLVGAEAHPPYERPPLSKAVLAGGAAPRSTYLFQPGGVEQFGVETLYGRRAVSIDRANSTVVLDDDSQIAYDRLILCTGGRARELAIPGAGLPNVYALRTIDDALAIGQQLDQQRRVVIVGAGWIGLEVAATARSRGAQVTVVEALSRPCERSVSREVSDYLVALHARNDVPVLLKCRPTEIARAAAGGLDVRLDDGRCLEADLVIIGAGLVANDELAAAAGLACEQGVLVDRGCRTSDPNIFAAGDVAVAPNSWAGRRIRLESWRNAQDQAVAAAKAALGQAVNYESVPFFWSQQYDVNLQLHGVAAPSHRAVVRGSLSEGRFIVFYLDGTKIRAAAAPNAPREMRLVRQLIEQQEDVNDEALADPSVPLAGLVTRKQPASGGSLASA
jgi:3-phenylpropionate/trans-cinnamate dioxygenase ferredoxin reductase subunit